MDIKWMKITPDKLEGLDEVFLHHKEVGNMQGMHELWVIEHIDPEYPEVLEIRYTLHFPERAVQMRISGEREWGLSRYILNYDNSREPREKKYNRKVLWYFIKRWAAKKYPGITLKEIYSSSVNFFLKGENGILYLNPAFGDIGLGTTNISKTGLSRFKFPYGIYHEYPDALENEAKDLETVKIFDLAPEPIVFDFYEQFLEEIGYEEKITS